MDIGVEWNDDEHGYIVSYGCPEAGEIENGDKGGLVDCCNTYVREGVLAKLSAEDVPVDLVSGGGMAF